LGRPLIGSRASCFLPKETHTWLDSVQKELGLKTKAELLRLIVKNAQNMANIIEFLKEELADS
jgi:hypothetical protein